MKLYMKQKVFSWRDKFYIKDEYGTDRYYVEGEFFTIGKKLHVFDMRGREVAYIHEKVFSLLQRFLVYCNDSAVAELVKRFTLFRARYEINGLGWEVDGSFWEHDYTVSSGMLPVVQIHKVWMSWGDSYELDIARPEDEVLALAVVLAIDAVMDAQAAASSANQ